jgi:citrate synthase
MSQESLHITDNRTGKSYDLPIHNGNIRAADLRQIKVHPDEFGMMSYDPSYLNTAACQSTITFIDGDKGILRYRGYPIEQLAESCTFLEVAYLLLFGNLPNGAELADWESKVKHHTMVHENVKKFMDGFHHDAHPMGMLVSTIAALSTFYPSARNVKDKKERMIDVIRLVAKMPTIAAWAYRHSLGLPYIYPDNTLTFPENFMNMLFRMTEPKYVFNPVLARALDVLFILHADHEQNCSTTAMRCVGSAQADPFLTTAAAASALAGPLHGGANEEVLKMLDEIGSIEHIPDFIKRVKAGEVKLMGFGHRVYKNYDPRAKIIKQTADQVFAETGRNPKLDIAIELEKIALNDEYFVKRKLYPNVDFYSGIIYQAMGFRPEMFTVLFAIPRVVGWLAQWQELLEDPEQKIARPRQVYTGIELRDLPASSSRQMQSEGVHVVR